MKIFILLSFIVLLNSFNKDEKRCKYQQLHKYEINNAVEIYVPDIFELRKQGSDIDIAVNNFRNNYNLSHQKKIGKSELVFQPVGTNTSDPKALINTTRITVKYYKVSNILFPKYNKAFNTNITELSNFFKQQSIQAISEMPYPAKLIKWFPAETGKINGQIYIKTSYVLEINDKKSYNEMYQFFNTDEKVIISFITPFPTQPKWKNAFETAIKTFNFKNKK